MNTYPALQNAKAVSNARESVQKAVLHLGSSEEGLNLKAVVILEQTPKRVAVLVFSHVGGELTRSPYSSAPAAVRQILCPKCGSPVFKLKVLERFYCFKCKMYMQQSQSIMMA